MEQTLWAGKKTTRGEIAGEKGQLGEDLGGQINAGGKIKFVTSVQMIFVRC